MRSLTKISLSLVIAVAAQPVLAADVTGLSSRCVSCHGATGISSNPLYPNLAGQKAAYLLKQMRDFQKGDRKDPVMNAMVQGLSEQDMDALAEFYSKK